MHHRTIAVCLAAAAVVFASCAQQPERSAVIVNHSLGVSLAPLPPGFVVGTNDGPVLELRLAEAGAAGTISFEVGPEDPSPNLIAALTANQRRIESMPDGEYNGGQELQGPLGSAFYSRGRYRDGSTTTEETRIFALHPTDSRLLIIVYRYPAANDSSVRVTQLLEIFALVDAAPPRDG